MLAQDAHAAGERVAVVRDDPPGRQHRARRRGWQDVRVADRARASIRVALPGEPLTDARAARCPSGPVDPDVRAVRESRAAVNCEPEQLALDRPLTEIAVCGWLRVFHAVARSAFARCGRHRSRKDGCSAQPDIGPFASIIPTLTSGPGGISGVGRGAGATVGISVAVMARSDPVLAAISAPGGEAVGRDQPAAETADRRHQHHSPSPIHGTVSDQRPSDARRHGLSRRCGDAPAGNP